MIIKLFSITCVILSALSLLVKFDLNVFILAVFALGIFVQELTIDKLNKKLEETKERSTRDVN